MGDFGGFGQKSSAKKTSKSAGRARHQIEAWGSPEALISRYKAILPFMQQQQGPARQMATDTAALGAQTGLQAADVAASRRGTQGSGFHQAQKQAIQGGRQAQVQNALTQYYMNAINQAMGQAGRMQGQTQAALAGVPITQQAPSGSSVMGDLAGQALAYMLI
jgi:hypothetical protein